MKMKLHLAIPGVIFFLSVWTLVVSTGTVSELYVGSPIKIMLEIYKFLGAPTFYAAFFNSAQAFIGGFSLALLLGVPLGLFIGTNRKAYELVSPLVYTINATPYVAILPLIIIWFGIGLVSKLTIVFLMIFGTTVIHAMDSTKTLDAGILEMSRNFETPRRMRFWKLYFYNAFPFIFAGVRIGVGRGLIAIIIAEMFGLGKGIAYDISYFGATYQTNKLLANVIIIVIISYILIYFVRKLQGKIIFWQKG